MDESTKTALEKELAGAVRQREQLDAVISYLSGRLGVDVASGGRADQQDQSSSPSVDHQAEPAASVREGEFFGMSSPDASRRLLEKFGRTRPMKTDEIFAAITKGGVKIQNSPTLYRSLTRDPSFLRVGRGVWGLADWYPASARKSAQANADDEVAPEEVDVTEHPSVEQDQED